MRIMGELPEYLALGPDNDIWATLSTNNIAQLNTTTSTPTVNQYSIPTPNSAPGAIITGPDKNLWFIETAMNQFGVVNPKTGAINEVPVLADGASQIQDLVAGPDGNIWFTELKADKIGEINPTTHAVEEFTIPTANSQPYGIVVGSDNNIWFTESGANKVGMINPTTHAITDYPISTSGNAEAEGITLGSDGNLWFVETAANEVAKFVIKTRAVTPYTSTNIDSGAGLSQITSVPGGDLWFPETNDGTMLSISPITDTITNYGINGIGRPVAGIVAGTDGNLYCGLTSGNFGQYTTMGSETNIPLVNTSTTVPSSLVAAKDGNVWFVTNVYNGGSSQVGVIDPADHRSIEYPIPDTGDKPHQVGLDPNNGALWYTLNQGSSNQSGGIEGFDPSTRKFSGPYSLTNASGDPEGITYNTHDGNFWFAEMNGNTIGTFNPTSDAIADNFVTLPSGSNPYGIVVDPSGDVWFTESGTGQVGEYVPNAGGGSGVVNQVALSSPNDDPQGMVLGPDGNLWFDETGNDNGAIGIINPLTGKLVKEIVAPITGWPSVGPDNAIWFPEENGVGRIDLTTYSITSFSTPNEVPAAVASGPDGDLYFGAAVSGYNPPNPDVIGTIDLSQASTPSQLVVSTETPADVTAGKGFGLAVTVDSAAGGTDTYFEGTISIALGANPGSSTLGGTLTATAVNGVANFPGLNLNQSGTGYTIVASSTGLTSATTSSFMVSLAATHLVVTSPPPSSLPAGSTFSVTVAAEDSLGNIDSSYDGTLDVALGNNPGGSTLSGTTIYGANAGQYTFSGLSLNNPGQDYTLLLTDAASQLQAASTPGFNVTPQPATQLIVTTEPLSSYVAGASFGLVIVAENNLGQVDTAYSGSVSLTLIASNGATLEGSSTLAFVNGIATFGGLSIDQIGSGYVIGAISGSLTSAMTTSIGVVNASAVGFTLALLPPAAVPGEPITLMVTAVDPFGNTVANYSGTVHFTSSDPNAGLPVDYTFNANDKGSHVFQNGVMFATLGSQTLTAKDSTVTPPILSSVAVQVNRATVTTTSLTVSSTSSGYGQLVTLTATVSPNPGTGTFTFLDGTTILENNVMLTPAGATLAISSLAVGSHSLSVSYSGSADGIYAPSTSATILFQVVQASTTLALTTSTKTTVPGHAVTLTATVQVAAPGSAVLTGVVEFLNGTTVIGSMMINAAGVATISYSPGILGTYTITASYVGSANYGASTSPNVQFKVIKPVQADFDGDGKSDIVIFDQTTSTFAVAYSTGGSRVLQFGNPYDVNIPVYGDFDGDGKTNFAIFDQTTATFYILESGQVVSRQFGNPYDMNIPVVGDFNGGGKTNFAIFDQTTATFYVLESGQVVTQQLGDPYDVNIPVAGDFDGDGKTDFAVYDQTQATFLILYSGGRWRIQQLGVPGDENIPIAADFDGDGITDLAVYDQTASTFLALESGGGLIAQQFGIPNDENEPVLGDFDGDGRTDLAIYDQMIAKFLIIDSAGGSLVDPYGDPDHNNLPG